MMLQKKISAIHDQYPFLKIYKELLQFGKKMSNNPTDNEQMISNLHNT